MEKRRPGRADLARSGTAAARRAGQPADPLGIRDRTMLEMFYSTGIRRMTLPPRRPT